MLLCGQNNPTRGYSHISQPCSWVSSPGETQAGVWFCYRTWKELCSSFYSCHCKNLPPPLMPAHALVWTALILLLPLRARPCLFSLCPLSLRAPLSPVPAPLSACSPQCWPLGRASGSPASSPASKCAEPSAASGSRSVGRAVTWLWLWLSKHSAQAPWEDHLSTSEPWSGAEETNPCQLNSHPAKTSKIIS